MSYYKKLGMTKEQWIKQWRKELRHRNWNPFRELEQLNKEQLEIFENEENYETKNKKTKEYKTEKNNTEKNSQDVWSMWEEN